MACKIVLKGWDNLLEKLEYNSYKEFQDAYRSIRSKKVEFVYNGNPYVGVVQDSNPNDLTVELPTGTQVLVKPENASLTDKEFKPNKTEVVDQFFKDDNQEPIIDEDVAPEDIKPTEEEVNELRIISEQEAGEAPDETIKWESYKATTTQDLVSETDGTKIPYKERDTFKDDDLNRRQRTLLRQIEPHIENMQLVAIQDGEDINPGQLEYGQVFVVVDKSQGPITSREEAINKSFKVDGKVTTLSYEGSLIGEARTFFGEGLTADRTLATHKERIRIRTERLNADGIDVTLEEVAQMFEDEWQQTQEERKLVAQGNPVIYNIRKVSKGHYQPSDATLDELTQEDDIYYPSYVTLFYTGEKKGKVFAKVGGKPFEIKTRIFSPEEVQMISQLAEKTLTPTEAKYLQFVLGSSKKSFHIHNNKLYFKDKLISSTDLEFALVDRKMFLSKEIIELYNDSPNAGIEVLVPKSNINQNILNGPSPVTMTVEDFFLKTTTLGLKFYKDSKGKLTTDPANRYLYFEGGQPINKTEQKKQEKTLEDLLDETYEFNIQTVTEGFTHKGRTIGMKPGAVPGLYDPETNTIYLAQGAPDHIRLEEKLHASTGMAYFALDRNDPRVREVQRLLELARSKVTKGQNKLVDYALYASETIKGLDPATAQLVDELEFLANAVSSPQVREALMKIDGGKSLLGEIVDVVVKILNSIGVKIHPDIYTSVMRVNIELFPDIYRDTDIQEPIVEQRIEEQEEFTVPEGEAENLDDLFGDDDIKIDFTLGAVENAQDKKEFGVALDYLFVEWLGKNNFSVYDIIVSDKKQLVKAMDTFEKVLYKVKDNAKTEGLKALTNHYFENPYQGRRDWLDNSDLFSLGDTTDLDNMIIEAADDGESKGRSFSFDGNEIDHLKFSSNATKSLLRTIREYKDGKLATTQFGTNKLADFKQLFYKTLKATQGSSTFNEMFDRLSNGDPQFQEILKRLPVYKDENGWHIKPGKNNNGFVLRFFQDLRKPNLDYYTVQTFEDSDGTKYEFILELNSKTTKIKEKFYSYLREQVPSPYFDVDDFNQPVANEALVSKIEQLISANKWKEAFDIMGIRFSDKAYQDPEFQKELVALSGVKSIFIKHLSNLVNIGLTDPFRQLSNDLKASKGFHSRLSKLVEVESKYSPITANFSIRNAEGNLVQGNTLPNSFTVLNDEVNKLTKEEYSNLKEAKAQEDIDKRRLLGNVFSPLFQYTVTNRKIFGRRKRSLEYISYGGMEDAITARLSEKDWLKMQINTMLKVGTNEVMRLETLTSAWAWKVEGMGKDELWVNDHSEFLNQMKEYLKGELLRIELAKKYPDFKFYNKGLSLFKDIIDLDLTLITDMSQQEIENFVEENFYKGENFKKQIEDFFKDEKEKLAHAARNIRQSDIDATILSNYDNLGAVLDQYLRNDLIYNIETSILYYGGVEWYKDFHKRSKGMFSTGQVAPIDTNYWSTRTRENTLTGLHGHKDNFSWKIKTIILKEDEAKSTFHEDIHKGAVDSLWRRLKNLGLRITRKEVEERLQPKTGNYQKMEIGDGQGWCTIDFYREFLDSVGNWNDKLEKWYQYEVAFYKKYEKGIPLSDKEEQLLQDGPTTNSTSLKVSYYGTTNVFEEINPQIFDKFSLSPLVPSAIYGKKLSLLNERLLESDIAYAKMQSGTKVAQRRSGEGPMSPVPFFDSQRNLIVPNLKDYAYELYLPFLKEQLKTDSKVKEKTITSTQKRKLLVSDLQEMGVWADLDWTPTQVAEFHNISVGSFAKKSKAEKFKLIREYQETLEPTELKRLYDDYTDTINRKTDLLTRELYQELGLKEENGVVKVKSVRFFMEQLAKELKTRDLNNAVADFIDLKLANEDIPFEVSSNKQSLQNLIQGIVNKKLVRQKLNGSQLIQVASTGYEELGTTLADRLPYEPTGKEETFPNNAQYGIKSKWQKEAGQPNEAVKKSGAVGTHEAIVLGLRTSTSRKSLKGVQVGDVINVGKTGKPLYARVTRVYDKKLKDLLEQGEMTPKQWSDREGWSEDYLEKNPQVLEKYPLDFSLIRTEKTGVTGLKFYQLKNGKTTAAETKVGMVGRWKPLLNRKDVKDLANKSGMSPLEALNFLIKDEEWREKNQRLLTFTGERIPVQGINSMEFFIVEEFLPETVGPIIIPPAELVIKSGGDYDIDKETIQIPVFDEEGNLIDKETDFRKFQKLDDLKERLSELNQELSKIKSFTVRRKLQSIAEYFEAYREYKDTHGYNKEIKEATLEEIERIKETLPDEFKNTAEEIKKVYNTIRHLEDEKHRAFAYLDNKLLGETVEFLSHELNYHQLVTPISTDLIAPTLREIGRKLHGAMEDPQNTSVIRTSTNIAKRKSLLTNPRLLGIVAVSNTFLQQYNLINARINAYKTVPMLLLTPQENAELEHNGEIFFGTQMTVDGQMKSELGSQHINATVDGAKEDYLGDANYSMDNMGMIMYIQARNVPHDRLAKFINQPIIYEFNESKEFGDTFSARDYTIGKAFLHMLQRESGWEFKEVAKIAIDNKGKFSFKKLASVLNRKFLTDAQREELNNLEQIERNENQEQKYQALKNRVRTATEQKILDSIDGGKLVSTNSLQRIWSTQLHDLEVSSTTLDNLSLEDLQKQIAVYALYQNLRDEASKVFEIQSGHNYDTSTSQTPIHAQEKINLRLKVENEGFFTPDTIEKLQTTTPTSSFNINDLMISVFNEVFPFNFDQLFIGKALEVKLKDQTSALKERYYRTVSNDLIEWVIKRLPYGSGTIGSHVDELLQNFVPRYLEFLNNNPAAKNTLLAQNLLLKQIGNKTYFYLLQDADVNEQNIYIENLELFNEIDPDLTKDLALLVWGQTGFNKTYFSWADLIPPSILKDVFLPAFSNRLSTTDIDNFFAEFRTENPMFFVKDVKKPNMEAKYLSKVERKAEAVQLGHKMYSGGALGSDKYWGEIASRSGMKVVHFRPETYDSLNPSQKAEIEEAYQRAVRDLGRKSLPANSYEGKLVRRDYLQAKAGDAVFAIGSIVDPGQRGARYLNTTNKQIVDGETGYAVQMAINLNKPVFVFDQFKNQWFKWDQRTNQFVAVETPTLTPKFAGVGTRKLVGTGKRAIEDVIRKTARLEGNLLDETVTEFRGKRVANVSITNKEGHPGGASTDVNSNTIKINLGVLREKYKEKAWTNPRELKDGTKASALPANTFTSYEQWLTFAILHEYAHFFNPKNEGETIGEYESRINRIALDDLNTNFKKQPKNHFSKAVQELLEQSTYIRLDASEEFYVNERTGERYQRVTSFISDDMRTYNGMIETLPENGVFVFGSNPIGINGNPSKGTGGAALFAYNNFGVKQGEKMDNKLSESGKAYGLVTVTSPGKRRSLKINEIRNNVLKLYEFAEKNPDKDFYIAYSGTDPDKESLNGYSARTLAQAFKPEQGFDIPNNIIFQRDFFNLVNPLVDSSARIGTALDQVTRDYFSGNLKPFNQYYTEAGVDSPRALTFASKELYDSFVIELDKLKEKFDANKEQVIAEDVMVFANLPIEGYDGIAGTLDLLTIDDEGRVRIYDLKSKRSGVDFIDSQKFGKPMREKWTLQLNMYRNLMSIQNGIVANDLAVIPIKVQFEAGSSTTTEARFLDNVTINVLSDVKGVAAKKVKTPEVTFQSFPLYKEMASIYASSYHVRVDRERITRRNAWKEILENNPKYHKALYDYRGKSKLIDEPLAYEGIILNELLDELTLPRNEPKGTPEAPTKIEEPKSDPFGERPQEAEELGLTAEQWKAGEPILDMLKNGKEGDTWFLSGKGGTGKTYTITRILKAAGVSALYTAPSHNARRELSSSLDRWNHAHTIASAFGIDYDPVSDRSTLRPRSSYNNGMDFPSDKAKVIIIDEVSMIGDTLWGAINQRLAERPEYYPKPQIVFLGDYAQIPPPEGKKGDGPIINKMWHQDRSKTSTLYTNMRAAFEDVSDISDKVRYFIDWQNDISVYKTRNDQDALNRELEQFLSKKKESANISLFNQPITGEFYDKYVQLYKDEASSNFRFGVIVNYNNENHRNTIELNSRLREMIHGKNLDKFVPGELVIMRSLSAHDGQITKDERLMIEEVKFEPRYVQTVPYKNKGNWEFNFETSAYTVKVRNEDGNMYYLVVPAFDLISNLRGDMKDIKLSGKIPPKGQLTALLLKELHSIEYGYVVNGHKVQGSSYDNVFVWEDNILGARDPKERLQLLYTAYSRTKKHLNILNTQQEIVKLPPLGALPNQVDPSQNYYVSQEQLKGTFEKDGFIYDVVPLKEMTYDKAISFGLDPNEFEGSQIVHRVHKTKPYQPMLYEGDIISQPGLKPLTINEAEKEC